MWLKKDCFNFKAFEVLMPLKGVVAQLSDSDVESCVRPIVKSVSERPSKCLAENLFSVNQ